MLDYGSNDGQGNLEGIEKGYSGGRDRLWVRESCHDCGTLSVGDLTGSQINGRLSDNSFLTAPGGGPSHYSVSF